MLILYLCIFIFKRDLFVEETLPQMKEISKQTIKYGHHKHYYS